jgi:Response regulator containing a CheY-like receiver domain and an HD-GYP domain
MREALENSLPRITLHVAEDGDTALRFLRRQGAYSDAPRPKLIFLDLNLPGKDGREVLAEIKQDRELRRIPVVVLTTSDAQQDIESAYELHANCYIRKPSTLEEFLTVIRTCEIFWFNTARLPPR